jgi:putative glutamine amidotransferase
VPGIDDFPLVGLTAYREECRWGVWDQRADVLPAEYAGAVELAGGSPVLLPPSDPGRAAAVVDRLDALVVSGGADVDPGTYGEPPHERTAGWREDRDAWELALLDAADRAGLPVLGICRGMQLMAVHAGGVLDQHTPDLVGHDGHSPGGDAFGDVEVHTVAGSELQTLIGHRHEVGCHHHQSVRTHPGFTAAAWAVDGTLEAMERLGGPFRVAVQWHPETREDAGLFRGLVDAARAYRSS